MRVVQCVQYGPIEDLVLAEIEPPSCGPGQVVVEVAAAGLNFVDALFVKGEYQIKPPVPFIPGSELAGTVTQVGDGVDPDLLGQRVMAMTGLGAFAESVAVPANAVTAVPDELSAPAAAALIQSYCTAWFALVERCRVGPDHQVLVLGASGGVGRACIDVAKAHGARVIAAASSEERREDCRAAGADAVIDSRSERLKEEIREASDGGVDIVIDPVGGPVTEPALRATTNRGRLVVIGFAAGEIPQIPANQILLRNREVIGIDWGAWAMSSPAEHEVLLGEVVSAVADGRLQPPEPVEYPLDQVHQALADLLENRMGGKAVLIPGRSN